jgi:hypothetical protein
MSLRGYIHQRLDGPSSLPFPSISFPFLRSFES